MNKYTQHILDFPSVVRLDGEKLDGKIMMFDCRRSNIQSFFSPPSLEFEPLVTVTIFYLLTLSMPYLASLVSDDSG